MMRRSALILFAFLAKSATTTLGQTSLPITATPAGPDVDAATSAPATICSVMNFPPCLTIGLLTDSEQDVETFRSSISEANSRMSSSSVKVRFRGVHLSTFSASLPATLNAQTLVETHNAFAILGPGPSSVTLKVQSYLATQDRLHVSYRSTSPFLSDSEQYPTFARVVASDMHQAQAMISFTKFYGWDEISIVYADSVYGISGHQMLKQEAEKARISVASSSKIKDSSDKSSSPGVLDKNEVRAALIKVKKSTVRIVVLFVTQEEACAIFEVAQDLFMLDSDTIWLVPDAVVSDASKLEAFFNDHPATARGLMRNLIGFYPSGSGRQDVNGPATRTRALIRAFTIDIITPRTVTSLQEGYLQDAVTSVVTAAQNAIQAFSISAVFLARTKLMPALQDVSFDGKTGLVSFDSQGDRANPPGYEIFQLGHHSSEMRHIGHWDGTLEQPRLLEAEDPLRWGLHASVVPPTTRPEPLDCTTCRAREDVRISIFSHGDFEGSFFWQSVKRGLDAAATELRVSKNLDILGVDDKNLTRIKDYFVEALGHYNKPDVIITSQPDTDLLIELVQLAAAYGVNVITFNTGEDVVFPEGNVRPISHVGMNNTRGGENAARAAKNLFGAQEMILCINHSPGAKHNTNRCKGVGAGAATAGLQYAEVQVIVREEFASYLEEGLLQHPSADAIVITSAKFIEETNQVFQKLGRSPSVGVFDLSDTAMDAIGAGTVQFAMRQNEFSQGYLPVILAMVEGTIRTKIKQYMWETGPDVITAENLDYVRCSMAEEIHCLPDPRNPSKQKTPVIGVITHARAASSFWPPILAGLKQAAIDSVVRLDMRHFYYKDNEAYDGSAESMAPATRELMSAGVDGMIMSDATQEIVEELNKAKIPFMIINKKPSTLQLEHLPMFMNYIGQDDKQAGKDVLERASRGFKPNILVADKGDDHPRILGALEAVEELGGESTVLALWEILRIKSHDASAQVQVIRDAIQADDRINMIFTAKSDVGLMAVQAAQALGRPIPIVTFDTNPLVMRKVLFGEVAMTVDQVPYMQGMYPVMLLSAFFKTHNRVSTAEISTGAYFLTPETVERASCATELSSSCTWLICEKGYFFQMETGTCQSCGPGTYQPTSLAVDDDSCISCPVGTFNPYNGSTDESFCLPAPNSTYVNTTGTAEPFLCAEDAICGLASTRSNITNMTEFDIYAPEKEVEEEGSLHESEIVLIGSCFILAVILLLLVIGRRVSCLNSTITLMDLYSPLARPKDEDPETYWGGVFTIALGLAVGCYCLFFAVSYFTSYTTTTSLLPGVVALEDFDAEWTPKRFEIRLTVFGNVGDCSQYSVLVNTNYDEQEDAVMNIMTSKKAIDECEVTWSIEDLSAEESKVSFEIDAPLAYATAVAWNVLAPSENPGETNSANGLLLPAREDEVIKGSEPSQISLTCYPTLFQDNTANVLRDGVRSQIQAEHTGSTVLEDEFHDKEGLVVEFKFWWSPMIIVKEKDRYQPIMSFVAEITALGGWFETILAIITTAAFMQWVANARGTARAAAERVEDAAHAAAEAVLNGSLSGIALVNRRKSNSSRSDDPMSGAGNSRHSKNSRSKSRTQKERARNESQSYASQNSFGIDQLQMQEMDWDP